ncbi:hypothetical protein, partial [Enterococcus faecium]|uniref:hypothetical protein n=1 Tax=Enterococcus faecium TaxID=1352 RepID=UPI0034E9420E
SSYSAVVYTLLAAFTAWLVHTRAAEADLHLGDNDSRDHDLPYSPSKWRGLVAFLILVPLFVGVIALWIGYTLMGTYLVSSVIISGLTVGTLCGLRD